jgi:aminoglycoside 3-N-acetyltransferase
MTTAHLPNSDAARKVTPDELSEGFERLGLVVGDAVIMHASLDKIGAVDGGAAMVLHRLLRILGKGGTLLMPTFTSATRHASVHENFTLSGCWCEGHEDRHLPFIPELQPDKNIGVIAQRLCSWPSSRRSNHPAYSFVAVGKHGDDLVREYSLDDPLFPIKRFLKQDPKLLAVGVGFDSVTAIHVAEQQRLSPKLVRERALTFTSKGRAWVDITALGCSNGFEKLKTHVARKEAMIGTAASEVYRTKELIEQAEVLLEKRPTALLCDNTACLSCSLAK